MPWSITTSPHQEFKFWHLLYTIILHLLKISTSPCFLPTILSFLEKIVSLPSENIISIIFKAIGYQAVIHDITDIIIHCSSIDNTHFDCACQAGISSNIIEPESEQLFCLTCKIRGWFQSLNSWMLYWYQDQLAFHIGFVCKKSQILSA